MCEVVPLVYRIVFVCTGNLCRSPMAQGILKALLPEEMKSKIKVSSRGTHALEGYSPALQAVEIMKNKGIDISHRTAKTLKDKIVRNADLILVMSAEHLKHIQKVDRKSTEKSFLLKAFPLKSEDDNYTIKDPIGGFLGDYNQCFLELDEEIRRILPELVRLYERKNEKS